MAYFPLLAFIAGAAIATQGGMNAQLGMLLKNSLMATAVAFLLSSVLVGSVLLWSNKVWPTSEVLRSIPLPLWFGGTLSALGVALFYYLIPKMGAGNMMAYALAGQIIIAMVISHFGWFGLPVSAIDGRKIMGVVALLVGVGLINGLGK
ncbi:DMT family transporter [Motilimonas cestriensis]|uniref:DMT family transporter n=1 Tax=Motilimonas cestriensis TaxID=2742685 RepID=A0ABS8W9Y2_9GAMM|nr:DMT family transporter [Motilimonas cestriensis]MCE2595831.1 DMT family transporter [Motilimonas cestriensis]